MADFNTGDTGEGESLAISHQLVQEILEAPNQNSGSLNNDGTFVSDAHLIQITNALEMEHVSCSFHYLNMF